MYSLRCLELEDLHQDLPYFRTYITVGSEVSLLIPNYMFWVTMQFQIMMYDHWKIYKRPIFRRFLGGVYRQMMSFQIPVTVKNKKISNIPCYLEYNTWYSTENFKCSWLIGPLKTSCFSSEAIAFKESFWMMCSNIGVSFR